MKKPNYKIIAIIFAVSFTLTSIIYFVDKNFVGAAMHFIGACISFLIGYFLGKK